MRWSNLLINIWGKGNVLHGYSIYRWRTQKFSPFPGGTCLCFLSQTPFLANFITLKGLYERPLRTPCWWRCYSHGTLFAVFFWLNSIDALPLGLWWHLFRAYCHCSYPTIATVQSVSHFPRPSKHCHCICGRDPQTVTQRKHKHISNCCRVVACIECVAFTFPRQPIFHHIFFWPSGALIMATLESEHYNANRNPASPHSYHSNNSNNNNNNKKQVGDPKQVKVHSLMGVSNAHHLSKTFNHPGG